MNVPPHPKPLRSLSRFIGRGGGRGILFHMKRYLFILLAVLAVSSPAWGRARRGDRADRAAAPRLTEAEEKQFFLYYYEAVRLRDQALYDQALDALLLCYAIDSLDPGLNADLGLLYGSIGLIDEAEAHLAKAVELQPENWWYNLRLINLLTERKQFDRAIRLATDLQQVYPYREDVYYMLASLYAQTGQTAKAAEAYNTMERMVGINETLSLEKFRLYAQARQNKKAVGEIDRLIAAFPHETRYQVLRGDIYMQQHQPDEALAVYRDVLARDPQNPYVYLSLSDYYNATGQPDQAMDMIVTALRNEQLDVDTKMGILGKYIEKLLANQKKIDETEELFKLLIEYYPLEEQVHAYYATFLQYQGRKEEMLDELETLLYINPANEGAWLQRLQTYLADGDLPRVLAVADQGLESLPESASLLFYKAVALMQQKDYPAALAAVREALALFDAGKANNKALQSNLYAQLGDLHYQLGNAPEAFEAYENALRLDPGNVYTMNNYAYYLSLAGENLRRAEQLSAKTVEAEPKNSTFLDTYAWILYRQGSYSLAKFYIERAIDNLDPEEDNSVLYDHYGDILQANGEKEKAVEMWRKAQELGLDTGAKIEASTSPSQGTDAADPQ